MMEEDVSRPGNFLTGSVKQDCDVPEHSDAEFFAKDSGNFLINDTTILPTTDSQVRLRV